MLLAGRERSNRSRSFPQGRGTRRFGGHKPVDGGRARVRSGGSQRCCCCCHPDPVRRQGRDLCIRGECMGPSRLGTIRMRAQSARQRASRGCEKNVLVGGKVPQALKRVKKKRAVIRSARSAAPPKTDFGGTPPQPRHWRRAGLCRLLRFSQLRCGQPLPPPERTCGRCSLSRECRAG